MVIPGFRFAAGAAGVKKAGGLDLALMVADAPAAAAGVFTQNRVKAAPVLLCRERLRRGRGQAILVNSGNANACTGAGGLAAARETTGRVAELLQVPEDLVLPASTGVIGAPLPVEKIQAALPDLAARLSPEGLPEVAQAILTTDTRPKLLSARIDLGGRPVTLAGVAKGAGMIHPNLATLLSFVFTDASVAPSALKTLLRQAVAASFNRITVDGDTSTNDTVLILASGRAGNPLIAGMANPAAAALGDALTRLLTGLAHMIVADAEGATRFFRVQVQGASSPAEAKKAAMAVATSPLVKTAMAGADVNWGRILAALGRSGARFHPEEVDINFGPHPVVQDGQGLGLSAEAAAQEIIEAGPFIVTINLKAGQASHYYDTCDLTEDYIRINASYRS
jgi:glutamate N-acetyltransferase/amino-acid N-acetyltransferase